MKKTKRLVCLFMAVAMSVSLAACAQDNGSAASSADSSEASSGTSSSASIQTITEGKLTMSTNAEFEPFEYRDNGEIVGIDVDIAKEVAKKLGLELEINDVDFAALVAELQSNKCDFVAAGMTADEDRKKNVDFSDSYFDASQAIIVQKGSEIQSRTDLNGKTVGVQQGTTGDSFCTDEDGTSDIKVGTVKRYNKGSDAVSDLITGRIDAVIIDNFPATKFVQKNSDKLEKLDDALTSEEYAIAVKKGDTALLDQINAVLKEMKSSGELDQIIENYQSALGEE